MDHWKGEQLNKAKEILAYELTSMVHGARKLKRPRVQPASCSAA